MKKRNVLIVTNSYDEHAHLVIPEIQKLGGAIYRIDTDRLPEFFTISAYIDPFSIEFTTPVGKIASSDIFSVWVRRPTQNFPEPHSAEQKFIKQETLEFIRNLYILLSSHSLVIDSPEKVYFADHKLKQLIKCKEFGLSIPRTLVTSSPEEAIAFYKKNKKNIIVKSLNIPMAQYGEDWFTTFTSKVEGDVDFSLVRSSPTFLQENIEKKTELRITIIGKKLFAVEFDSQSLPYTKIDWRRVQEKLLEIPHRVVKLPLQIEKKLRSLLDYYGLNFGAIDMARTPDDEYVFFELNPAGQFLWLDDVTDLNLAQEMAKFLLGMQ